jgi:hypothetical protein
MYEMVVNDLVTSFGERAEAVQAAKELTAQPDRSATANVSDGVETLSFRNGKLIAYSYETRMDRRHRSYASGPTDGESNGSSDVQGEAAPVKTEKPEAKDASESVGSDVQE